MTRSQSFNAIVANLSAAVAIGLFLLGRQSEGFFVLLISLGCRLAVIQENK